MEVRAQTSAGAQDLFPAGLPANAWAQFAAAGYQSPVWGMIYHAHRPPSCGMPLGGVEEMLKSAVAGETHEYTDMYPGMAKAAREEGFKEIADWFETLAKAEKSHAGRFQKMLDSIK
jgi:hypothetical protein